MSKFAGLLKILDIDETNTKPIPKEKTFNKVKDTTTLIKGNNQQIDILYLPTTYRGFKYLLTAVDLADNACDFEPMKNREASDVLEAYKEMNKRPYIKIAKVTITTDSGGEFRGVFHKFLNQHNIFHRVGIPDRHKQTANVENLNKQLGRLINGYLNKKEEETGKTQTNWIPLLPRIRDKLNEIREVKVPKDINTYEYPIADGTETIGKGKTKRTINVDAKFKIGDKVYYKSEVPLTALGVKQNTKNFRVGDRRWNMEPKKITKILLYPAPTYYRYMLEGLPNVSYVEKELRKA